MSESVLRYLTGEVRIPVWGAFAVFFVTLLVTSGISYSAFMYKVRWDRDQRDAALAISILIGGFFLLWELGWVLMEMVGRGASPKAGWWLIVMDHIQLTSRLGGKNGNFFPPIPRLYAVGIPSLCAIVAIGSRAWWAAIPVVVTPLIVLWPQL